MRSGVWRVRDANKDQLNPVTTGTYLPRYLGTYLARQPTGNESGAVRFRGRLVRSSVPGCPVTVWVRHLLG